MGSKYIVLFPNDSTYLEFATPMAIENDLKQAYKTLYDEKDP